MLNVACYRFVSLNDLQTLRERLWSSASARGLKGTVLLAPEGINLSIAGLPAAVRDWLAGLREEPGLQGLDGHETLSRHVPFRYLRVRIKREIIRLDRPTIRPAEGRAPALAPQTLARWLAQGSDDDGRPLRLLDTRNAFEVDAGSFEGALDWRLPRFSAFAEALASHRAELEGCTVVTFCTGGIRCEKAALLMQANGHANTWQLDGGILGYFRATGGEAPGWRGRCVVFDEREAVDSARRPQRDRQPQTTATTA